MSILMIVWSSSVLPLEERPLQPGPDRDHHVGVRPQPCPIARWANSGCSVGITPCPMRRVVTGACSRSARVCTDDGGALGAATDDDQRPLRSAQRVRGPVECILVDVGDGRDRCVRGAGSG